MSGNKLDSLGYLECSQADEWKWIVSEDSSWLAKHRRVDEIQTGRCNEASLVKPPPPSSLFIKLPSGDTGLVSPEHCLVWHLASRSHLSVNTQANISLPPPVREIQSPMGRISTVCCLTVCMWARQRSQYTYISIIHPLIFKLDVLCPVIWTGLTRVSWRKCGQRRWGEERRGEPGGAALMSSSQAAIVNTFLAEIISIREFEIWG